MKTSPQVLTEFNPAMYAKKHAPLVSLYLTTHRNSLETSQDRLRYKNLLSQAEELLKQGYQRKEYEGVLARLNELLDNPDETLWRSVKDGLAVLADVNNVYIYYLDYPVSDLAVVAGSFHIKPLIRNFQYGAHYYLLSIASDSYDLYCGDFHTLEPIALPEGVVNKLNELFDDFDNRVAGKSGAYGKTNTNFFGYEPKNDKIKIETEKFFRYINEVIHKHFQEMQTCPVILVGLEQNQALFRSIAHVPTMLPSGIDKRYESMTEQEVIATAASIIEDMQRETIKKRLDSYGLAFSEENASPDPRVIADALSQRKIASLFIEAERFIPGRFDSTMGTLTFESDNARNTDDLTDDFAQATYLQGGEVYVLNREAMPSETGVAALFRY